MPGFPSFTETWHTTAYDAISPARPELSARGKNVIITGGGTGIGKAIATAFSQAGAASVAIIGRREDRLKEAIREITDVIEGSKATKLLYEVADLTDQRAAKQAFENIVKTQGGMIHVCVSNAGATPKPGLVIDTDVEEFMTMINTNFRSTLNTVKAFIPHAAENATLINVSTGLVHMLPRASGISAHAVSKATSMKLIEYVQAENPGLHVVSIQPGSVKTEATQNMKVQSPDDASLAGCFCVWLTSEEAKFLKGKYVWANWDVKELMARADAIRSSRLLSILLEGVPM